MKINPAVCTQLITASLDAGLVPMVAASPGVGKSDIVKQISLNKNLKLIDFRLSQADPTDLNGFPSLNEARTRSHYAPPDTFPIEGDDLPLDANGKEMNGWLLFLDELSSAPVSVQAAAYKVVLDKQVGAHNLHEKVHIVAAGNLVTDKAIANKLSTAMQSRMVHLELSVSLDDWLKWASKAGIDGRILSFLNFKPELLHNFDPNHNDKTFPCPRTWEFASRLISNLQELDASTLPLLAGTIGEGAASELRTYLRVYKELPTFKEMIAKPNTITIPNEPSTKHAITGMLSHGATMGNMDKVFEVIVRLPKEFQVLCVKQIGQKNMALMSHPSFLDWSQENANR